MLSIQRTSPAAISCRCPSFCTLPSAMATSHHRTQRSSLLLRMCRRKSGVWRGSRRFRLIAKWISLRTRICMASSQSTKRLLKWQYFCGTTATILSRRSALQTRPVQHDPCADMASAAPVAMTLSGAVPRDSGDELAAFWMLSFRESEFEP